VPEYFVDPYELYKRLSWGYIPEEILAWDEIQHLFHAIFDEFGRDEGLPLRHTRLLWMAVVPGDDIRCGYPKKTDSIDFDPNISIRGPLFGQSDLCEPVLNALPEWFGLEDATQHYLEVINRLPTILLLSDNKVIGFLTIKQHFQKSAEIYVIGVLPQYHRHGLGRLLVSTAESYLLEQGIQYLQVKTLGETHPDEGYKKTCAFYQAMGFQPLEELKKLWDETNPALLLIKKL
jgi:ribosomal protein S18 acetylase RimI-like enzyme